MSFKVSVGATDKNTWSETDIPVSRGQDLDGLTPTARSNSAIPSGRAFGLHLKARPFRISWAP